MAVPLPATLRARSTRLMVVVCGVPLASVYWSVKLNERRPDWIVSVARVPPIGASALWVRRSTAVPPAAALKVSSAAFKNGVRVALAARSSQAKSRSPSMPVPAPVFQAPLLASLLPVSPLRLVAQLPALSCTVATTSSRPSASAPASSKWAFQAPPASTVVVAVTVAPLPSTRVTVTVRPTSMPVVTPWMSKPLTASLPLM
ncbi:hypothetical protein D3C85_866310 [compost metagenome]